MTEGALADLDSLLTAAQSAALHENYAEAVTIVDSDTQLAYLAMIALLLHDHPDKRLAAAVRGTALVRMGLPEYITRQNPLPDTPEGLEP